MTGPIILLTFCQYVCVCVCVRGLCCLRYLTRRLINIEMTSGREVQRLTSGERQEGGREGSWRKENRGMTAHEERREEKERNGEVRL